MAAVFRVSKCATAVRIVLATKMRQAARSTSMDCLQYVNLACFFATMVTALRHDGCAMDFLTALTTQTRKTVPRISEPQREDFAKRTNSIVEAVPACASR